MSSKIFNNLARGAGVATVLAMSSVAANATNINISVASNFYISGTPGTSPIADLIQAFTDPLGPHSGDTVTVVKDGSTGTLTNLITSGNVDGVDLFLAADADHPNTLYSDPMNRYTSNAPFNYATGVLAFHTNTSGVDVTCATGTCGYDSTVYAKADVAMADPSTAPYGVATKSLLEGRYGKTPFSNYATQYANINLTFDAVNLGSPPPRKVGFIALSQVCSGGAWPTSQTVVYPSTDTSVSPAITNYAPIVQAAVEIKINRSRSGPEDALLADFVTYLQDHTMGSQMMTTLANYCYTP